MQYVSVCVNVLFHHMTEDSSYIFSLNCRKPAGLSAAAFFRESFYKFIRIKVSQWVICEMMNVSVYINGLLKCPEGEKASTSSQT